MNYEEKIEDLFLIIMEQEEYKKIEKLFLHIKKSALDYLITPIRFGINPIMKPIIQIVNELLQKSEISPSYIIEYLGKNDDAGWCKFFCCTRVKWDMEQRTIEFESDELCVLIVGYIIDNYFHRTLDLRKIITEETFLYENKYGLTNICGAEFKRDGLIFKDKFYLYNFFTNTKPLRFGDSVPAFIRIFEDDIKDGDILYRIDENLSVPKEQAISYSSLDFERYRGPQFRFSDSILQDKKTIIVHYNEETMDKLLMVVKKQETDDNSEPFWHIEIEVLPNVDVNTCKSKFKLTVFLHGIYYPQKDIFTHIDYTINQYNIEDYIAKYSDCDKDIPIDFYAERESHYKIWCMENGLYSKETWYKLVKVSLPPLYQELFDEMLLT